MIKEKRFSCYMILIYIDNIILSHIINLDKINSKALIIF